MSQPPIDVPQDDGQGGDVTPDNAEEPEPADEGPDDAA